MGEAELREKVESVAAELRAKADELAKYKVSGAHEQRRILLRAVELLEALAPPETVALQLTRRGSGFCAEIPGIKLLDCSFSADAPLREVWEWAVRRRGEAERVAQKKTAEPYLVEWGVFFVPGSTGPGEWRISIRTDRGEQGETRTIYAPETLGAGRSAWRVPSENLAREMGVELPNEPETDPLAWKGRVLGFRFPLGGRQASLRRHLERGKGIPGARLVGAEEEQHVHS